MAPSFVLCSSCERHVRVADRVCPFCAAAMPEPVSSRPRGSTAGLSRAAILFAGATAVTGCSATSSMTDAASDASQSPDQQIVAAYGPVPVDVVDPSDVRDVQTMPDEQFVAAYGPAPVDVFQPRDVQSMPDEQVVAAYGPVPVDAGRLD
jgi:hypothetical protein